MIPEDRQNDMEVDPSIIFRQIARGLSPAEIYAKLNQKVYGQDEQLKKVSILVSSWLRAVAEGEENRKYNFIITGSTASGKTTTINALKKILPPIPVKVVDSSILTGASFKGVSVNSIFDSEIAAFGGAAIICLDELDKCLYPRHSAYGENISLDVQNQLLKILDGETLDEKTSETINTSRILFIGSGAFEGLLDGLQSPKTEEKKSIGFIQNEARGGAETVGTEVKDLSLEHIAEYGGNNQFIGRFLHIVNYNKPSMDVYRRLIFDVVCEVKGMYNHIPLDFLSDEDMDGLVEAARNGRFGIRGLRSLIWDIVFDRYIDSIMQVSDESYFYKRKREEKGRYGRITI